MSEDNSFTFGDSADEPKVVAEPDSTAHFEPVVRLAPVEVRTGEEDENCLYKERAKLYRFDQSTQEWKERGTGDVRFMQHKEFGKVRILMRQEKTLKLVLNHHVQDMDLKPNLGSDRAWTWGTVDYSEPDAVGHFAFAIKFKTPEVAVQFKAEWEKYRAVNKSGGQPGESKNSDVWGSILKERQFTPLSENELKTLWNKYDTDKSGFIEAKELEKLTRDLVDAVIKTLAVINEAQKENVRKGAAALSAKGLKALDKNADAKISWAEFLRLDDVRAVQ